MTEVPAGWQPDPRGRHEHRYWDGTQWTDHVADQGEVSHDPVAGAAATTPAATEPVAVTEPAAAPDHEPEPATKSTDPTEARAAAQDVLHSKSPGIGTILSAVVPGSGHFYLGAANAVPVGAALLGATLLAVILSYFNFVLFLVGFAVWAAAAAFALSDLRGGVQSLQGVSLPAQVVGILLIAAGALLIVSLLLPFYHVSFEGGGLSFAGDPSGFQSFDVEDVLLLVIGLLAVAGGAVSLGLGPVTAAELPRELPLVVAVGGAIATLIVLFRMFVDPAPGLGFSQGGADIDIGRAPGIWLALWASLVIVLTNLGTLRSLANRSSRPAA